MRNALVAVDALVPDSSPGYPWMRLFRTNQEMVDTLGREVLAAAALRRVEQLSCTQTFESSQGLHGPGVMQSIQSGLADPIRVFVKNELHSSEKVKQGRMRVICSVSVIDQLVERLLFTAQNKAELSVYACIPSKPGLGLHDEGLEILKQDLQAFDFPVETDVSGFDWSVKGYMLAMDADMRVRLADQPTLEWTAAVYARFAQLSRALFVFSDGRAISQIRPGLQKSGSYNTSSTNSRMRILLAYLVGSTRAIAMGDDCVEEYASGAAENYARLGLLIKAYERTSLHEGIEFCSTLFSHSGAWPVNPLKVVARLLNKRPASAQHAEELLASFNFDMRHHPALEMLLGLISRSGWGREKTFQNV